MLDLTKELNIIKDNEYGDEEEEVEFDSDINFNSPL